MRSRIRGILGITLLLVTVSGCAPASAPATEEPIAPTEAPVEEPATAPEAVSTATAIPSRFTIQSAAEYQDAITTLYTAFFEGEPPVFSETEADLSAVPIEEPTASALAFLPGVAFELNGENADAAAFAAFAASIDGQAALIDAGLLPSSITVTDQAGVMVDIAQPVRAVITAHGPSTFFYYTVGAADRLVSASYLGARDPAGAAAMAAIDPRYPDISGDDLFNQTDFSIEDALLLEPDLVAGAARSGWIDVAGELDIPILQYEAESPDALREAVLLTGEVLGPAALAQAEAWVAYYDSVFAAVLEQTADIPDDERVRVLFTGTQPLNVASGEMYQAAIIEAAGGLSVSADLTGYWNEVNLEQIAAWDPDVIIVPPYGGASVAAITDSPEWQILEAVQAGRVYRMPKLVAPWDTPTPDSVLGIVWLAGKLYPDRVDLDCAAEAETFYNTFYGYAISADELSSVCGG